MSTVKICLFKIPFLWIYIFKNDLHHIITFLLTPTLIPYPLHSESIPFHISISTLSPFHLSPFSYGKLERLLSSQAETRENRETFEQQPGILSSGRNGEIKEENVGRHERGRGKGNWKTDSRWC